MKHGNKGSKGSKWWVAVCFGMFFTAAPVPGGEAKLNFNGAYLFNVNVTQVTNNVMITSVQPVHPSFTSPKPKPKVNKVPRKGSCVR
ncbi:MULTISPECIES: hypothetical protein [Rahnella]|uniref:hypothetical protein n=1 Tax=Rahnella TaxID=34037 RepID=UPI001052C725|nr:MULTISPECIES: hypothetical protein [Rahnella]TCQ90210.1 hypothetical protein EC840_1032 [Rahnella sp. JUb53]